MIKSRRRKSYLMDTYYCIIINIIIVIINKKTLLWPAFTPETLPPAFPLGKLTCLYVAVIYR